VTSGGAIPLPQAEGGFRPLVLMAHVFPKRGESPADCQDAIGHNAPQGCFAVADGVGESFLPAPWARSVAERFCSAEPALAARLASSADPWDTWLEPLVAEWKNEVRKAVETAAPHERVSLRNRAAHHDRAATTFVGLVFQPTTWRAVAVGDSCLFQLRGDQLEFCGPLTRADQFTSSTPCVETDRVPALRYARFLSGTCKAGDLFVLATDAFSKWLLTQHEAGGDSWRDAVRLVSGASDWSVMFREIERLRARADLRALVNDDVAILTVSMQSGHAMQARGPSSWDPGSSIIVDEKRKTVEPESPGGPKPDVPTPPAPRRSGIDWAALIGAVALWIATGSLIASFTIASEMRQLRRTFAEMQKQVSTLVNKSPRVGTMGDTTAAAGEPEPIQLRAGTIVRSRPDSTAPPILTLGREVQVIPVGGAGNRGWHAIEIDVWIVEQARGSVFASVAGDRLDIVHKVTAHSDSAVSSSTVVGSFTPTRGVPLLEMHPNDTYGHWYRVKVSGFVKKP